MFLFLLLVLYVPIMPRPLFKATEERLQLPLYSRRSFLWEHVTRWARVFVGTIHHFFIFVLVIPVKFQSDIYMEYLPLSVSLFVRLWSRLTAELRFSWAMGRRRKWRRGRRRTPRQMWGSAVPCAERCSTWEQVRVVKIHDGHENTWRSWNVSRSWEQAKVMKTVVEVLRTGQGLRRGQKLNLEHA